ncbi:MAG: DUF4127 family protein, partial [Cyanobacteria bacterium REEB65]|nr:DUF4127 family protein [Cyanobacteria bacterium REEB65]
VLVPPPELLGDLDRAAPSDDLLDWLDIQAPRVDAAILGLDTLLYGGLIAARRSVDPLERIRQRLERIAAFDMPVYAFSVTMRISDSRIADEEMAYWADYGKAIYRWSFHADRHAQRGDPADAADARRAREAIPDPVAADFLDRRKRLFAIQREAVELAHRGRFRVLCLTQDDTSPFGFNQAEKRALEALGGESVLIYPGADEVAACLVGRCVNDATGRTPILSLHSYPPGGADRIAMYEDRPLRETAAAQVRAVGGRLAGPGDAADLDLLLNAPSGGQGDLALQTRLELVDEPPRDLQPLIERLRSGPPAVLADVAYANGADPRLWDQLAAQLDLSKLAAFSAWNTAGNTIGTVVAMASAFLSPGFDPGRHRAFMRDRLAEDYLYQTIVRQQLRTEKLQVDVAEGQLGDRLAQLWRQRFPQLPIAGIEASFPWHRTFEAAVRVMGA